MRVLVTGSNGLLGTKLLRLLRGEPSVALVGTSRQARSNEHLGPLTFRQADLTRAEEVAHVFRAAQPEAVIHTAAMTDVDGCERQPERAWRENVDAAEHVARAAARGGARLVHLSTEYVFDGTAGPYGEDDPPNPLGVYGRSKLHSEQAVQAALPDAVVARTTVLYGWEPNTRPNFVTWLVEHLRAGKTATIATDQVGSPTLADSLAEMCWALARNREARGVFNTVGTTVIDRFAFARLIAREFGLDERLLQPTDTASLRQASPRPLRAGLRMDRFQARFPTLHVPSAAEGLSILHAQVAHALHTPPTGTAPPAAE